MDPKKQDLNPELKEIYNRVMNTQVKQPTQETQTPSVGQPPSPPTPTPQPVGQPQAPAPPPMGPPIESKPFVFTGNKVTTQDPLGFQSQLHTSSTLKIPKPVTAASIVLLIIGWEKYVVAIESLADPVL